MRRYPLGSITRASVLAASLTAAALVGSAGAGATAGPFRGNPTCKNEGVFFAPGHGQDIVLPRGYRVQAFASGLNFPTGIAFRGTPGHFRVLVLESGSGLPGRCNVPEPLGRFARGNPFTSDIVTLDQNGRRIGRPVGKPRRSGGGFQLNGPAIDLAFSRGFRGGTLFATDNRSLDPNPAIAHNSSRISRVGLRRDTVRPVITGLPAGDHFTEQLAFKGGWMYWSQGSTTNSAVVGHDNAAGKAQHDVPCQRVTLSDDTFPSGDGHRTSGFSPHGVARPGATLPAFSGATRRGMCTGAILRARLSAPQSTIEPFSWGYRNPFGIRFAPLHHPLHGNLFVTENGEDLRGARPVNNAPDRLQVARQNPNGSPDYHGWPDRFGFLDSTQRVFNPIFGPSIDDPKAVVGEPVEHVLDFPPQPPVAPLALEPADSAVVGLDFAPASFTGRVVERGAALVAREGDLGFGPENGEPGEGHDVQLVNFGPPSQPAALTLARFAFNCPADEQTHLPNGAPACESEATDQAFVEHLHGINRPITAMFGPDGALYVVDYGAVRDVGKADPEAEVRNPADLPFVQIPHTGVIWRITRVR